MGVSGSRHDKASFPSGDRQSGQAVCGSQQTRDLHEGQSLRPMDQIGNQEVKYRLEMPYARRAS